MKKVEIFVLLFVLVIVLMGCQAQEVIYQTGEVIINNQKIEVEIADKPNLIQKGLSDRERLSENQGMLFIFSQSDIYEFWMKNMKFSLDIIWINNNQIVEIWDKAPMPQGDETPHYQPQNQANYVLEVNAGTAEKHGWKIGDKIELRIKN